MPLTLSTIRMLCNNAYTRRYLYTLYTHKQVIVLNLPNKLCIYIHIRLTSLGFMEYNYYIRKLIRTLTNYIIISLSLSVRFL